MRFRAPSSRLLLRIRTLVSSRCRRASRRSMPGLNLFCETSKGHIWGQLSAVRLSQSASQKVGGPVCAHSCFQLRCGCVAR
eukprot:2588001-Prorocentrum_lima.AAC.1